MNNKSLTYGFHITDLLTYRLYIIRLLVYGLYVIGLRICSPYIKKGKKTGLLHNSVHITTTNWNTYLILTKQNVHLHLDCMTQDYSNNT